MSGEGIRNTFFFGCNSGMVPGGTATNEHGTFFERRTVGPLPPGEVVSLAIVFDEGTEFPPGYVFLDDIRVAGHTWSSATDNGRGGTTTANTPVTAAEAEAILGEPPRRRVGLVASRSGERRALPAPHPESRSARYRRPIG